MQPFSISNDLKQIVSVMREWLAKVILAGILRLHASPADESANRTGFGVLVPAASRKAFQKARAVAPCKMRAPQIRNARSSAIFTRRFLSVDFVAQKVAVEVPENRAATAHFPGIRRRNRRRQQDGNSKQRSFHFTILPVTKR